MVTVTEKEKKTITDAVLTIPQNQTNIPNPGADVSDDKIDYNDISFNFVNNSDFTLGVNIIDAETKEPIIGLRLDPNGSQPETHFKSTDSTLSFFIDTFKPYTDRLVGKGGTEFSTENGKAVDKHIKEPIKLQNYFPEGPHSYQVTLLVTPKFSKTSI